MSRLAINGGPKLREHMFPPYLTIGAEERAAVERVLKSGCLSRFLGTWHEDFFGGPEVRALEAEWAEYVRVKHAIAVNSATSGLFCAAGAAGIGPGDEVIVSPYTMSASAVAPLVYNAIPVFADIEEDFFCLDPASVEARITERTRAIIVVDIFGQPYDAERINAIARKHNLVVIEDCAQAPGATYNGNYAGTLGDIGVFSLNYHKHIHTGEGGIVVTDNDELADRVRLIRNHAESVVEAKGATSLVNMLGFNYRMTEVEAAIGREQLKKLSSLLARRRENVAYSAERLATIPCLEPASVRSGCEHAFYVHTLKFDAATAGIHRNRFVDAVRAELAPIELRESEGVKVGSGYVKPIYLQPMFQQRIAYDDAGCPWTCGRYGGQVVYDKGICPVVEDMHENILITHELMRPPMTHADLDDVVGAFMKVWENRGELL
jgi:dTDP-4-amino-4,6-dideoxygalactose transaminase